MFKIGNRFFLVRLIQIFAPIFLLQSAFGEQQRPLSPCSVISFGAKGDGQTKDTEAIQKAIDACAEHGGGTVFLPPGTYLSGSLHLRNNIGLHLDSGATLLGSKDEKDYDPYETLTFKNQADRETSFFHYALIWGEDAANVSITGMGTIDANRAKRGGPKPIALKRCKRVTIKEITIRNAPNYNISMLGTDDVMIDGVTILNGYCDGIDPDGCRNVSISNCHIESWDDAIVLKTSFSLGEHRSTERVTVTNCLLATACNAFKLGTESGGDFKRIAVSNCVVFRLGEQEPPISGISLETVDGANVDGVVVSNVTMTDARAPIFLRLGNRGRDQDKPTPGTLKNILIENVAASGASLPCTITGIPDHPIKDVTLSNIRIAYRGGDPLMKFADEVQERVADYPDADMFEEGLPAYGLYCRHAEGIKFSNLQLLRDTKSRWRFIPEKEKKHRGTWTVESVSTSGNPAGGESGWETAPVRTLVCDQVTRLEIESLSAQPSETANQPFSVIRFIGVRDAMIYDCVAPQGTRVYLEILDPASRGISLIGNDLTEAIKTVQLGRGVKRDAVSLLSNRAH